MRDAEPHGRADLPGGREAFERLGTVATATAGVVAFSLTGLSLLTVRPGPWPYAVLVPILGLWLLGLRRANPARARIQSAALLALLACPYALASVGTAAWMPSGVVAFAAAVGAALSLQARSAFGVLAGTAALAALLVVVPVPSVAVSGNWLPLIGGWSGVLFLLVSVGGLILWRRIWQEGAERSDRDLAAAEDLLQRARRDAAAQAVRHQVERRIHETVLNTLLAVGNGSGQRNPHLVREVCRQDVARMSTVVSYKEPVTLDRLLRDCVEDSRATGLTVELDHPAEVLLPAVAANTVRDAVAECLRNVQRHSGSARARIESRRDDGSMVVTISDRGHGIAPGSGERFGMRQVVRRSITLIGGDVAVESAAGHGTTVRLTVPVPSRSSPLIDVSPVLEAMTSTWQQRVVVLATAVYGVLTVPFALLATHRPADLAIALAGSGLMLIAMTAFWRTPARRALAAASLVAFALPFAVMIVPGPGASCSNRVIADWAVNVLLGATILPIFALGAARWRWAVIPVPFVAATLGSFLGNPGCGDIGWSLVSASAYLAVVVYASAWLFARIDQQRDRAVASWAAVNLAETEAIQLDHAVSAWNFVRPSTLRFLASIANGEMDPGSEKAMRTALEESAAIRRQLSSNLA